MAILHWAISGALFTAYPHKTSRQSEDKVEAITDAPEFLALLQVGPAHRFFFSSQRVLFISITIRFKAHSNPTVLKTSLLPTKPYWLVRRVPKQSCKREGSQKLKQVLVMVRLLGKKVQLFKSTALIYIYTKCWGHLWVMAASENEVMLCTSKTKHRKRRQKWMMNVTSAGIKHL